MEESHGRDWENNKAFYVGEKGGADVSPLTNGRRIR